MKRRLCGLAIGVVVLCAACLGEPVSKKVGAGSTITLDLVGLRSDVVLGFGSTLGGPDLQRGDVRFVLCVPSTPRCNPDPALSPRQGFRLQTTFMARGEADRFSMLGLTLHQGIVTAIVDVPASGLHRPAAGVYRLEPRVLVGGSEQLAVDPGVVRTLEITSDSGTPSLLTDGSDMQLAGLRAMIPKPSVRFVQAIPQGGTAAAAVELTVRYPANRVSVLGAQEAIGTRRAAFADMVTVDSQTVRLLLVSGKGAADLALAFELLPGAGAVSAGDFSISTETLYDSDGRVISGRRFSVDRIL